MDDRSPERGLGGTLSAPAHPRPGAARGDRLRRPGQLRRQHHLRCRARLRPGVGRRLRQLLGHGHPVPRRQARHGHRQEPRGAQLRALPRRGPGAALGPGRARRHHDRPRRDRRRRDRPQAALRYAAHGGRRVRDPVQPRRPGLKVRGRSHFESVVLVLLVVIIASLVWQVFIADVDRVALLRSVVPGPLDSSAALLAVGIVGATVMPHALHFHSAASRGPRRRHGRGDASAGAAARRPPHGAQRRHRHDRRRRRQRQSRRLLRRPAVRGRREHRDRVCRPRRPRGPDRRHDAGRRTAGLGPRVDPRRRPDR